MGDFAEHNLGGYIRLGVSQYLSMHLVVPSFSLRIMIVVPFGDISDTAPHFGHGYNFVISLIRSN